MTLTVTNRRQKFCSRPPVTSSPCFRDTDTVARLGGDELVVLLEGIGSRDRLAEFFAERVLDSMQKSDGLNSKEYLFKIGASIGIALLQGRRILCQLLRRADSACYQAKALGRSIIV